VEITKKIGNIVKKNYSKLIYYSSFFVLIIVEFAIGGLFSRLLNKENFHTYIQIANYLPFYNIVGNLGISFSLLFFSAGHPHLKQKIFSSAQRFNVLWYIILISLHLAISLILRVDVVYILLLSLLISFPYSIRGNVNHYYLAQQDYNMATVTSIAQKLAILTLVSLFMYYDGLGKIVNEQFLVAYPLIEIGVIIIYFLFTLKIIPFSDLFKKGGYEKRIFKYGRYVGINSILSVSFYSLITLLLTLSEVDIQIKVMLGLCFIYMRYSGIIIAPIVSMISPQIVTGMSSVDVLSKLLKKFSLLFLVLALITIILIELLFDKFFALVFDESYIMFPLYFRYFYGMIPILFLIYFFCAFLNATGKVKLSLRTEVMSIALIGMFAIGVLFYFDKYNWMNFVYFCYLYFGFKLFSYFLGVLKSIKFRL
jgi:hypothetical protein